MDPKELRGLMEAYSKVYAPQEVDEATAMAKRGHDETAIRNKIAKSTGGGEAADRATKLADKQTFRGDGSARDNLARKQRGDFRKTTSSSPGLHGYPHKSNDPAVKEKQAARGAQRGVLTPDEKKRLNREEFDIFDIVLEFLQVEGYAETLEEAEWLMSNVIDDEAISIILGEEYMDEALTGERYKKVMKKPGGTAYSRKVSADPSKRATRGGRGGESDFGAGDRGSGNKAARRAGTYQEEEFAIDEASSRDEFTRAAIARSSGRKGGITFEPGPNWDASANRGKGAHISPKQKEKQRRKALRQEAFESWLDEALTGERYKKVMNKPGWSNYTRMHSADPEKRPTRGGRGGKQSDFGSPDRGTGNKAARRSGKSVDDSRYED